MNKLLIVSSSTIHVYNYIDMVKEYFDEILLITDKIKIERTVNTIEMDFSFKKAGTFFKTPKRIRDVVKSFNPSIIHIHQVGVYSFITLKAIRNLSIKTVLTAWGSDILLVPNRGYFNKKIVLYSLTSATILTSDSRFMAEKMKLLSGNKNLNVVLANFGIKIKYENTPKQNIIYSNRLHKPLYRIDKIIDAFSKFAKTDIGQDWKLIIGATGTETEKLKELTQKLNLQHKIDFCGWVDAKTNLENYSKSKIFISIPESDATSISLLEAMECECLPIVSDLPANREWIVSNENGLIINNFEEDFISSSLNLDFARAISINKKLIQEHATIEVNKKKFIAIYNQLKN